MTKRRSRGDGGLSWSDERQRWIAVITVGCDGRGKGIVRRASGKTKTEAKDKLKEIQRVYEDGLAASATGYTVGDAINYWLVYGLNGRSLCDKIRRNIVFLCEIPEGRAGRPSKSLTLLQAEAILKAAEQGPGRMSAYITSCHS